jgi:TonB family protein
VGSKGTIEVISKFRGADVLQYLSQVFNKVQTQPSFSLVKKPPLNGQGKSVVEFSILSDGSVGYTKLIHSSGHQSVDQALITAIQSGAPFPALSPESKGKPLKLRWHTVLNPKPAESKSH